MPSRRGGARKNAGRKRRSQTLGRPGEQRNQPSLQNFFGSQESTATLTQAVAETKDDDDLPLIEAPMPMPIEAAEAVEAVRPQFMPNNDVDPMDYDDNIHSKGKRLENSMNLSRQKQHIMSSAYYKKAFSKVDNEGMLWDIPPTLIKKTKAPMQMCWLDFFQLRIFNWIPEAMIDKDWRPLCPHCNVNLSRNGHTNPPLLVFDLYDNYWLNSPNKYICQSCEDFSNSCDNEEDKRQSYFTSTSSEILQQIGASYQELVDMFPCETSHKNTIDKSL